MDIDELKYKGERFSIRWDPKEEILFLEMWGSHTKKDAEEFIKNFYEIADKIPGTEPMYILVDTSKQTKTDHEARRIYSQKITKHPRPSYSAICGANVIIRLITGFIAAVAKKKNIKSFATAEEGLKWLRKTKAQEK